MARPQEADPRWIVEERADATNVNNWHWSEKDATFWSKEKLKQLLVGLSFDVPNGTIKTTEMVTLEGEATANNRKAKLIFFYEWKLSVKWQATPASGDKKVEGEIEVLNLSEENDMGDIDMNVTVKDTNAIASSFKEAVRVKGVPLLRAQLGKYIKELKEEFSKGLILPTSNNTKPATNGKQQEPSQPSQQQNQQKKPETTAKKDSSSSEKFSTKTLTQSHDFKATANDVYDCLVNVARVQLFTQSPCQMETKPGGFFTLYNGNIVGNFVELVPGKKVVQDWRFAHWPSGHFSRVTIVINEAEDHTQLTLTQSGIPANELESTDEGWKMHFWQKIKGVFGYGSALF